MPPKYQPRPPLQTRVAAVPHQSLGWGEPYDQAMRALSIHFFTSGEWYNNILRVARRFHVLPSNPTIYRWLALIQRLGHCRSCQRTGNARATVLPDHNIVFLSLYCVAFPKALAAEINDFLFRVNYGNPLFQFYLNSQVTCAEIRIGLTRKCGSTTAYQAFLPWNRLRRWCY